MRDEVFREQKPDVVSFAFDEHVADVFADMLNRSVPGYAAVLSMISVFAQKYAQPHSYIYDLGCSLGTVSLLMAQHVTHKTCSFHAYDLSDAMVKRAQERLLQSKMNERISVFQGDITTIDFMPTSVTVLNLTLQFIEPAQRQELLTRIYNATLPGGILILTEKIYDTSTAELYTDLYYDFKRANGYNDLEISQKRSALENILITDTEDTHTERLYSAGFERVERWFQMLNFRAYTAWKK